MSLIMPIVIEAPRPSAIPARNPYRAILRRDYPEPLIALLAFILGIWLWDHYFGKIQGYAPGTEEISLIKIDRDLRLADAMSGDPAWLRWIAGVDPPTAAHVYALTALEKLSIENSMTLPGLEAYAILKASHENLPVQSILAEVMQGQLPPDFIETSESLAAGSGTWWQARFVQSVEKTNRPVSNWRPRFDSQSKQLRTRAILARSSVWLIGLAGLFFLPKTLATLYRGFRSRPGGYGGAWTIPLGAIIFLVATLAWIGFTMTLELGISALPGLHPAAGILLDSAARLLPALIALGLLFRRPSHAARVLGINRPFSPGVILGLFSLLLIIDQILRSTLGSGLSAEPGGGLSAGEAGWWGLAFAITSACLLAPVSEEILYRGVLFRAFWNRIGLLPAGVLSSFIFAILHFYNGYGLASVAVFGLSCALLYAGTGSLGAAIVLHVLYNSAIKIPEWMIYHAPLS